MLSTKEGMPDAKSDVPVFREFSESLVAAVKKFEGFRAQAERDNLAVPPVWTIGYGETMGVQMGDTITPEEAETRLRIRLKFFSRRVNDLVKVPLTQGQHDALTDFAYNLGTEALRNSTLLRVLNAGRYDLAAAQFERWTLAGGVRLPGLIARRYEERTWFLVGVSA